MLIGKLKPNWIRMNNGFKFALTKILKPNGSFTSFNNLQQMLKNKLQINKFPNLDFKTKKCFRLNATSKRAATSKLIQSYD